LQVSNQRQDLDRPLERTRGRDREISQLGSSQGKGPSVGHPKSRSREVTKWRSGERTRVVHLRRTGGRDRDDLVNSGVCRVKAQVLGAPSHEATKWQEDKSRPIGRTRGNNRAPPREV
jgi:hypothetical protein